MLEQMIIARESKVSYEYLDSMDFLTYDVDFRWAYMMMTATYRLAEEKAEKKSNKEQEKPKHSQINPRPDPISRALEVERMMEMM